MALGTFLSASFYQVSSQSYAALWMIIRWVGFQVAGSYHFSMWASERQSWQSDAESLSLLMAVPFSIIIPIIRKLGGQKVFTVNLPPPQKR